MKLKKHEAIIHAWCEAGLSKYPLLGLLIRDGNQHTRIEYLQLDDLSPPLSTFLLASSFMSDAVTRLTIEALDAPKPRKKTAKR